MKKTLRPFIRAFAGFAAVSMLFLNTPLFAQMSPPAALLPKDIPASLVGVVAAAKGNVEIAQEGQVGRVAGSGEPIYLGDEVRTDEQGHLQILLLDETVFTIGPNSALVIDTFVYDPATHDGKIDARVVKGVFRFVTGQIAHKKPSNVEVKLPTGSVGVRGTIFYGKVEGSRSTLLLLGPGEKNNTGHRQGRILVSNDVDGKPVETEVKKSGFGSRIEGENIPPSAAFEIPKSEISEMISAVSPIQPQEKEEGDSQGGAKQGASSGQNSSDKDSEKSAAPQKNSGNGKTGPAAAGPQGPDKTQGSPGVKNAAPASPAGGALKGGVMPPPPGAPAPVQLPGTGSATQQSGQAGARAFGFLRDLSSVAEVGDLLSDTSQEASLDIGDKDAEDDYSDGDSGSTLATYDELRARTETGTYHYEGNGTLDHGTYSLVLDIDFGNKTFGGGNSRVGVTSTVINSGSQVFLPINGVNFAALQGDSIKSVGISYSPALTTGTLDLEFHDGGDSLVHQLEVTTTGQGTDQGEGTGTLKSGPSA